MPRQVHRAPATRPISLVAAPGTLELGRGPSPGPGRSSARILGQDGVLHAAQRRSRFQPEVVDEPAAGLCIGVEGLGLGPRAVQSEHEQLPAVFSVRLLGGQLTGHADQVLRQSSFELSGQQRLLGAFGYILEPPRLDDCLLDMVELGERTGTP